MSALNLELVAVQLFFVSYNLRTNAIKFAWIGSISNYFCTLNYDMYIINININIYIYILWKLYEFGNIFRLFLYLKNSEKITRTLYDLVAFAFDSYALKYYGIYNHRTHGIKFLWFGCISNVYGSESCATTCVWSTLVALELTSWHELNLYCPLLNLLDALEYQWSELIYRLVKILPF